MQRHFDDELGKLKDKLFKMGNLAQEAIRRVADSLARRDTQLAEAVIEADQKINMLEIEVDELGHELIALMQPTAIDLRFITMVLKVNSDLERIGDQAVNIAQESIALNRQPPVSLDLGIQKMVDLAVKMVQDSLNAFAQRDAKKARAICEGDDELDDLNDQVNAKLQKAMDSRLIAFPEAVNLIMVAHNFERIGDLATNIAEDVIYLAKGVDIRHHIVERRET